SVAARIRTQRLYFNDQPTLSIHTLSLHDALPISTQCTGWIPICDISSAFAPGADHAYNAGTDPSSNKFTSGWPQVQADMRNYIYGDINGNARCVTEAGWDAGAILYSARPSLTH